MTSTEPLVTADWLKSHIKAPDVRVVDATWVPPWSPNSGDGSARRLYLDAHIPGAVFFDIDEIADAESPYPHMMPSPEKFSSKVRKMGLGDGKTIIVYDRSDFMASARVWWMFRLMGHKDVKVLDGGWTSWLKAGGHTEDLEPIVSERHHTVRMQSHLLKTIEQMKQGVASGDLNILDARPADRFAGAAPEPREGLSSGHMPGAFNVPAADLLTSDGTLKSAEELKHILSDHFEKPNLTASCGSGVSAAIILLALSRLGRDDVALYDGSWTEWASQPDCQIATV
ncbi:MAG: 3-mercaptopyruvate sulfurtransferase [Ponticaulis sp.]|nr:3-mercaptopyruvate sulfurtransferase [Ponticaulis sp.]|tara:strand:- start:35727 stop:36578 length:852 start_codon:yes stop_codon:yes gene_type:complete